MRDRDTIVEAAKDFVALILRDEEATPERKGWAVQAVLDEAGFLVAVGSWDRGHFSNTFFGPDKIEAMLWISGLLDRVPQQGIEEFVVSRIRRSSDRHKEERDLVDYERLEEAERAVQEMESEGTPMMEFLRRALRSIFG